MPVQTLNKKYLILAIASTLLLAVWYILLKSDLPVEVYYTIGWIVVVLVLLVVGNSLISSKFDQYFPWLRYGRRRFFLHLFLGIAYSLFLINLAYLIFKIVFTQEPPTYGQIVVTNVYGLVIFIPAFCIYFSLHFLRHWQTSELETEKFKKETLKSQLDHLKNHLDPHFLFNNLNILSALIDKSAAESKEFLEKFAEVYRLLLKKKEEDLISLKEELNFVDDYIYLLKTRFEENVIFNIDVGGEGMQDMIPPLTLQLLIENAIKHNAISEKKPLIIEITSSAGVLRVCNSLNERKTKSDETSGSGLENIKKRYAYFTDEVVVVKKKESQFCVEIPLIEVQSV